MLIRLIGNTFFELAKRVKVLKSVYTLGNEWSLFKYWQWGRGAWGNC